MATARDTKLSASLEDYLEAIFHIVQAKQVARAKEIASRMKVTRSSVTGALHALADRGLINYAPYDVVTLTDEGKAVAGEIVRCHQLLRDFFVDVLSVGQGEADKAACRMEHGVSDVVVRRLSYLAEFIDTYLTVERETWQDEFLQFCRQHEKVPADRANRVPEALEGIQADEPA